jgi:predicted dienelactone hydrolase
MRVRAVVSLAPAVGQAFDAQGLSSVTVPVQIVVGSADAITPPNINANHYAKLIRGARLTVIPHAGHMVFGSMCTEKGKEQLSVICKDEAGVDRGDLHERVQQLTSEFFEGAFKASSIRR